MSIEAVIEYYEAENNIDHEIGVVGWMEDMTASLEKIREEFGFKGTFTVKTVAISSSDGGSGGYRRA